MCDIANLPFAVLHVIISQLSNERDIANARLVCKRWADVSCAAVTSATPKTSDGMLRTLDRFPNLHTVDLRLVRNADAKEAARLGQLRFLQRLGLANTHWSAAWGPLLSALAANCHCITHLEMNRISDELALQLGSLTQLQELAIAGRLSNTGLGHLSSLQQLQQLTLSCCDGITDDGLQVLIKPGFSKLQTLQLYCCLQLGDDTLQLVGQLTQLTHLNLSHSCEDASSEALLYLSTLTSLRQLNLTSAPETTDPNALAQLIKSLTHITNLDLSYCEAIHSSVLRALAGLQHIQVVGLSGLQPICLHSLQYLSNLSKLQQLQLRWVGQLKDSHMQFLPHLGALTALDLSYCRNITAVGLAKLQWLTQLQQLNMLAIGCVDLECLQALSQLKGLTVSLLSGNSSAWQHIGTLKQLNTLALRRCYITSSFSASSSNSNNSGNDNTVSGGCNTTDGCRQQEQGCSSCIAGISCRQASGSHQAAADAAGDNAVVTNPALSGVSCLSSLQQLTALDLSGSMLAHGGMLAVLQQLPLLQQLSLLRCNNVTNSVLSCLAGCYQLRKLDLRLRGQGSSWNVRGLVRLLKALPGLSTVYMSEVPVGLPADKQCRALACGSELVVLPVAMDVACGLGG